MVIASKIKSSIYAWLCVMVVMLGLAENRAWGFFEQPQPASGVFATSSPEAIGENYDAWRYDASGYAVASNNGASLATNRVNLQKQLASQEQLGQLSTGGGTVISQPAKQADRIARQTGRDPANIQKVCSDARTAADGQHIETHAFRDAADNSLLEPKTVIDPNGG